MHRSILSTAHKESLLYGSSWGFWGPFHLRGGILWNTVWKLLIWLTLLTLSRKHKNHFDSIFEYPSSIVYCVLSLPKKADTLMFNSSGCLKINPQVGLRAHSLQCRPTVPVLSFPASQTQPPFSCPCLLSPMCRPLSQPLYISSLANNSDFLDFSNFFIILAVFHGVNNYLSISFLKSGTQA